MRQLFIFLAVSVYLGCFSPGGLFCQTSHQKVQPGLPPVFLLGEHDRQYEETMPRYATLLDACGGDMEAAFAKLSAMMRDMETYAAKTNYDLKGVNAWMHFFFKQDGSIEHIGFYLKPNSRNVDTEGLKIFLAGFARQHKFPLISDAKYAHYSSFSFPVVRPFSLQDKSSVRKNTNKGY